MQAASGEFARMLQERGSDPAERRWIFVPYDQLSDRIGPLSREDPAELHNIGSDARYGDVRRRLAGEVERWWSTTGGRDCATYESDAFKQNLHNTWAR